MNKPLVLSLKNKIMYVLFYFIIHYKVILKNCDFVSFLYDG